MKSLNSSLVDAGEAKATGPGVGSGALVGANELQDKELSEPALLGVALLCVLHSVGVVEGLAWPLGAV